MKESSLKEDTVPHVCCKRTCKTCLIMHVYPGLILLWHLITSPLFRETGAQFWSEFPQLTAVLSHDKLISDVLHFQRSLAPSAHVCWLTKSHISVYKAEGWNTEKLTQHWKQLSCDDWLNIEINHGSVCRPVRIESTELSVERCLFLMTLMEMQSQGKIMLFAM